jgi:hypothetical protein
MANYVKDVDLYYEIVLSKGKGDLTERAEQMFILIAENAINKLKDRYPSEDELADCKQQGIMRLFENWRNFNEKKYNKALPYITELFKRGTTDGYNLLKNKKYKQDLPKMISIERSNDGKGLHTIS